jgi:NAD(P)-dependent dehydrogenase (short-subunit alcohol dehydrogenase family)
VSPVALVTGGSRGIGAATCIALADAGWDVCVNYRADTDSAASVRDACAARGVNAIVAPADIANFDEVGALFAMADELGPLGALVNNAGIVDAKARVDEMSAARVERMFAVNAVAPLLCAGQAVRRMSTAHGGTGGVIVNVSSTAVRIGAPNNYVDYAASKASLDVLTIGLAREVATEGIRVNAVRPGIVDTEIHASGGQPDRAWDAAPQIPLGRPGLPVEIARAIVWLCSNEASYVTGAILDVSGGR